MFVRPRRTLAILDAGPYCVRTERLAFAKRMTVNVGYVRDDGEERRAAERAQGGCEGPMETGWSGKATDRTTLAHARDGSATAL